MTMVNSLYLIDHSHRMLRACPNSAKPFYIPFQAPRLPTLDDLKDSGEYSLMPLYSTVYHSVLPEYCWIQKFKFKIKIGKNVRIVFKERVLIVPKRGTCSKRMQNRLIMLHA